MKYIRNIAFTVWVLTMLLVLTACGRENYDVKIVIPPTSTGEFAFSGREITPIRNKIIVSADAEVTIKLAQVREENSYELTVTASPEVPVEVLIEKGTWHKIAAANQTGADTAITIQVHNSSARTK